MSALTYIPAGNCSGYASDGWHVRAFSYGGELWHVLKDSMTAHRCGMRDPSRLTRWIDPLHVRRVRIGNARSCREHIVVDCHGLGMALFKIAGHACKTFKPYRPALLIPESEVSNG